MFTIQAGKASDVTNDDFRADISEYARFETAGGLQLVVGIVADAVRGGGQGPQVAIAGAMQSISASEITDIPTLVREAYESAHRAIRLLSQQEQKQLATTLTMALIVNNDTLYVANLGHSRVYLLRAESGQLVPLTLDHYFSNIAVQDHQMSAKEAAAHPDAGVLSKYVGTPTLIEPDLAIYGGVSSFQEAIELGRRGIKLLPGDCVLIASDGLTKPSRQGSPVITVDQIKRALYEDAQQAAFDIVELSRRQRPTDTISIAVLRAVPEAEKSRRIALSTMIAVSVASVLFVLSLIFVIWATRSPTIPPTATVDAAEQTALAAQAIVSATPTMTSTPRPAPTATRIVDPIGVNYWNAVGAMDASNALDVFTQRSVSAKQQDRVISVNHGSGNIVNPGLVFAQQPTALRFEEIDDNLMVISLQRKGDIFVAPFDYARVEIRLIQIPNLLVYGEGACIATYYVPNTTSDTVTVSCYSGTCSYQLPNNNRVPIPAGSQVQISLVPVGIADPLSPIPDSEAQRYREIWGRTGTFNQDACF